MEVIGDSCINPPFQFTSGFCGLGIETEYSGNVFLCFTMCGILLERLGGYSDLMAGIWNHLQVLTLTYLLHGQRDWETRTANQLGGSASKVYVFREQGRRCTFSDLILEVTAFCWLQVSQTCSDLQGEGIDLTSLLKECRSISGHSLRPPSGL